MPDEHSEADIQGEKQHVFDETYDTEVLADRKEVEVVIVDDHCDEKVHKDGKEVNVLVLDGTKRWHLRLRKKVVWPIKRIIVAVRKKTCDEATRIDKDQIVMNLSPSMEILKHKYIIVKNLVVPTLIQIGEVIFNEVPSNLFILGLQEFYILVKSTNNKYQRIGRHERRRSIQGTWILVSLGVWCRSTHKKHLGQFLCI